MQLRWAARILVLALAALMVGDLRAQVVPSQPAPDAQVELGQNYPNPFNLDTRIPFSIGKPPQCEDPGRLYRVTMRIYNLLSQLVAVPVLHEGSGSAASGQPLENVMLTCDRFVAYWDGKLQHSTQDAPRGIYLYQLEVDGKRHGARRMMLVRR